MNPTRHQRARRYATRYALLAALCFAYGIAQEARLAGLSAPDWIAQPDYWWRTPDQRGMDAFAQGDWTQAAAHFRAPLWRGAACYRAGDLACASTFFSTTDTPEARYNLGNVTARRGQFGQALSHYDAALATRPDWPEAIDNRRLVLALIAERTRRNLPPDADGEPMLDPDQVVEDQRGARGKPGRIDIDKLDPNALAERWLRQLRNDPGDFLRLRFADELARKKATP